MWDKIKRLSFFKKVALVSIIYSVMASVGLLVVNITCEGAFHVPNLMSIYRFFKSFVNIFLMAFVYMGIIGGIIVLFTSNVSNKNRH